MLLLLRFGREVSMGTAEREKWLSEGFHEDQIEEIRKGQEAGVDVSSYARKELLAIQMRQIRLGLVEKLDVSLYARSEFDWFQMEEIRLGLKSGVNAAAYAIPKISYEQMRQMRKGLEEGMNLFPYLKWEAGVIRQIRKAKRSNVDIIPYIEEGYDAKQLVEIRIALEKGIDIGKYISKEYIASSIAEICTGIEEGLDVALYASVDYSWQQMREIRKGLEQQVDVTKYSNALYSWQQMREIRIGLKQGLDVESYRLMRYTSKEMHKKRIALLQKQNPGLSGADVLSESTQKTADGESAKAPVTDEDFEIVFGANGMEAYITVHAGKGTFSKVKLLEVLEKNEIRKGILEATVEEIMEGQHVHKPVLIAKGELPDAGEDGYYEYFFRTQVEKVPRLLEDGSVDYHNIEWFEMVEAGQTLAIYHPAKEGADGYNVKGEPVKARKGAEKRILTGKGFRLENDKRTYTAIQNGMIQLDGSEMRIINHLVLEEVHLATGNVAFNGSVHIRGDVGAGVEIRATGDIVVDGTVEAATIESGGSVILKKGMNAGGKGLVFAQQDVISRFLEAANVQAKGNIEVDKCLNSMLNAGGIIRSAKVLAGGRAQAEKGFILNHVGNHVGIETRLRLLVDEEAWIRYKKIREDIKGAQEELRLLLRTYDEFQAKYPPEARSQMPVFAKVENAVFTKKKHLEDMLKDARDVEVRVSNLRNASVVIGGHAYAGTVVEMDGSVWHAENQYNITLSKKYKDVEIQNN